MRGTDDCTEDTFENSGAGMRGGQKTFFGVVFQNGCEDHQFTE